MTVYTANIAAGSDDAWETDDNSTTFNGTGTTVQMNVSTNAAVRSNGGLRFPTTGIPEDSTINAGTFVTWTRGSSAVDSPNATLYCELNATSPNFVDSADVTGRTPTAAGVLYQGSNLGAGAKNTPDLAAPVQEQVNLTGFDGTVTFIFKATNATAAENWRMISFEGGVGMPAVTIDYTEPVGGGAALVQRTLVGVGV